MTRALCVLVLGVTLVWSVAGGAVAATGTGTGTASGTGAVSGTGTGTASASDADSADGATEIDVSGAEVKPKKKGNRLWAFFGRTHPLMVHLPLAWLVLLLLADVAGMVMGYELPLRAGPPLAVITALASLPALVSGFARAAAATVSGALVTHRNLMIAMTVLIALAAVIRWRGRAKALAPTPRAVYATALGVALALALVGAHYGATMVYGDNYLF